MDELATSVDGPIFLIGTGRCGTTILLQLLGCHPDVAWISNYTNRLPQLPQLAFLSRVVDIPIFGDMLARRWRVTPKPVEPIAALNYVTDGVFSRHALLSECDVTEGTAEQFRAFIGAHLRWQGKKRFLNKHTGFARNRYLKRIFPNGIFLHLIRDGRAVVSSLLRMRWWDGTLNSWWWGPMKPEYAEEYANSDNSPIILGAIVWKTLLDKISDETASLGGHEIMTVRYDTLIEDYRRTMIGIADFCKLASTGRFLRRLDDFDIRRTDHAWKTQLTHEQQKELESSLAGHLEKYGFTH
jgi:hypothetical protein